jgi:hypothetical protein
MTARYPCSPTCTHDDAETPGHPERVSRRSREFVETVSDSQRALNAFLSDGEPPCTCAGTVDGDPTCIYCNMKEEARAALGALEEQWFGQGAESFRAAIREEVVKVLQGFGLSGTPLEDALKAVIEDASKEE